MLLRTRLGFSAKNKKGLIVYLPRSLALNPPHPRSHRRRCRRPPPPLRRTLQKNPMRVQFFKLGGLWEKP
jgi:hypothetical protein